MTHLDPEIESVILLLWGIPEEEEEVDPFSVPYRAPEQEDDGQPSCEQEWFESKRLKRGDIYVPAGEKYDTFRP